MKIIEKVLTGLGSVHTGSKTIRHATITVTYVPFVVIGLVLMTLLWTISSHGLRTICSIMIILLLLVGTAIIERGAKDGNQK